MALSRWLEQARAMPGAPGLRAIDVDASRWRDVAQDVAASGGRLLALWGGRTGDTDRQVAMLVLLALVAFGLMAQRGAVGTLRRFVQAKP